MEASSFQSQDPTSLASVEWLTWPQSDLGKHGSSSHPVAQLGPWVTVSLKGGNQVPGVTKEEECSGLAGGPDAEKTAGWGSQTDQGFNRDATP